MARNPESTLAKYADVFINIKVDKDFVNKTYRIKEGNLITDYTVGYKTGARTESDFKLGRLGWYGVGGVAGAISAGAFSFFEGVSSKSKVGRAITTTVGYGIDKWNCWGWMADLGGSNWREYKELYTKS